ncbi:DUF2272 domain-containing protein [Moraxella oblonga]|uniref:DUF2272 domain-containing protein n=1 Tax=Moraxella oblonga TaxID=200413 RepID=UPI000A42F406|nr:DUF2272 domain-containing protein [Moraxella oblonga]
MIKPLKLFILTTTLFLTACVSADLAQTNLWQSPTPNFSPNTSKSERIATIALREHQVWGEPFITIDGKIAKYDHYEADNSRLADGSLAWERVVAYWRDGNVLTKLNRKLPYHQCNKQDKSINASSNICRAFASDVAWSATFVSYVMMQAGVDFETSPRHFDYIRHSWLGRGDYRVADPLVSRVAVGDLLCYVRGDARQLVANYQDLHNYLTNHQTGLPAHCDIAVNVDKDKGEAWFVGGNVMHTVMLRKMKIGEQGQIILPQEKASPCTPKDEQSCQLNRQAWVVLLKLVEG